MKGDVGYLADSSTLLPPGSWVLPRDFCGILQAKTSLSSDTVPDLPYEMPFFQDRINGLKVHCILFEV